MSMQYSDLTTALGDLLVIPIITPASATPSSSADFNNILPRIIDSAEQRIYRELDFLHLVTTDANTALTANSRTATLPTSVNGVAGAQFVVVQSASAITPAPATPLTGTRNPLERSSKAFIDMIWPTEQGGALNTVPQYFALVNDTTVIVAPTPDAAYKMEYTGVYRPAPMSASNTATYLGTNYPDIFLAACMVFGAAYQKNFSESADDPKMAMSWESNYQSAKTSAMEEAQRQKSQSQNWSPYSPAPSSSPRP